MSGNCAVCDLPAKNFCSACKSVKYCSADHQKKHWKTHKVECRQFEIAKDEILGRHLVAKREIKAGSTIFVEAPLVVGPKWYLSEQDEHSPIMPCVGCFSPCHVGAHFCPNCHWPACSESCGGLENLKLHAAECPILSLGRGPQQTDTVKALRDYYRTDALMVLKCLMLQKTNPKKYAELMDMQSHEEERLGSELYVESEKRIVSYLQTNYLVPLKSLETQSGNKILIHNSPEILHKICGIIETNYMCINLPTGLELSGVFYTACMMEHSCQPNCYFQFDYNNGFKISVLAGREIKEGEHLQIMYSNMLWGTQMRHEHLQITKHFQCECKRCVDRTELGTYFSGMKCVGDVGEDCTGYQLPKDPMSLKTDWVCDTCPMIVSGEEVRYLLTQMSEEVDVALSKKPTVALLTTLLEKLSKFLHPNHYLLFSIKHSLIQLLGTDWNELTSEEELDHKYKLCEELLAICDKLDPFTIRLSIYVGIILYEMQKIEFMRGKNLMKDFKIDEAILKFKEARNLLLRAADNLKKELDNIAGSKLSDQVLKAIKELNDMITSNWTEC